MRHARVLAACCAMAAAASCTTPREQAAVAQALNDAANEIGGLKSDVAQLQSDVDSLRQVVAKQDTIISRIIEVNHIPR
jgi:septal ring factor EnvC (AmiA/AmiB activator)